MPTIVPTEITVLGRDRNSQRPAGEMAHLIVEGVKLREGLAAVIPLETHLLPLTSVGDRHTYRLIVRGYTVPEFIAIAKAHANEDFEEADRLIAELSQDDGMPG